MKEKLIAILEDLNPDDYKNLDPENLYESDYDRGFIEAINITLAIIDNEL